jgi:uncharacterized glyoxalase superfamily metalloenzyme YdcJ
MATMKHVNPDDMRTLFSRAMSDMYRAEVPQYAHSWVSSPTLMTKPCDVTGI